MKKDIIYAVILLVIYFALTCLITLVNSSLTTLGIYFYLPGLFFLSSSLFFDTTKSFIICLLIGIFLDTALETPLDFTQLYYHYFK
jgi:hypothetical protein